jgi:hypothetical protein
MCNENGQLGILVHDCMYRVGLHAGKAVADKKERERKKKVKKKPLGLSLRLFRLSNRNDGIGDGLCVRFMTLFGSFAWELRASD